MRSTLRFALVGLTVAFAVALPAAARDDPAVKSKKKQRDPNEVVCENQEVLGSRLATRRICMTRAEWADRRREERTAVERGQMRGRTGQE